ncbi:phosphotransferase family protein [Micromonospora olivasterospora]|uniref:Phosphotransferase family enzyme n=1 Tax=Micromonospora olivasterospora TaxID=1880 RepID=A0A562IBU5_MICOL|nr:phosphotransferase [Micromonospora olivasterospora]TWH68519.1 phosphotransferase family enzyme [Micromonospora olivasterospora]
MFVEARTRPVLAEVCRRLGYCGSDAILLRHHSNAVYAVDDVVIKIAPGDLGVERVRAVVAVVDWLTTRRFPTVELHPGLAQPLEVGGHAVTVWQRLDPAHRHPITVSELGTLLRDLHALPAPPMALPALRPIHGIVRSVARSEILTEKERALLTGQLEVLAAGWETMRFPRGTSLIQSDPQIRNALRRFDGTPVLADWDGAALGPREWDIATIAVHCRRFASPGPAAFADFTAAYGWDATSWPGFEELCQLRELQMIATNARKSRPGTEAADEVHHRIAGLVGDEAELRRWRIL